MIKLNKCFISCFAYVLLGVLVGWVATKIILSDNSSHKKNVTPYFYIGERKEQLPFVSYSDSLYFPDSSVKAFRHGIVDNPKLAADIGIAVLFDIYGEDMKDEYPFVVAKCYSDWTIHGTLPEGYFGGVGFITLTRYDGMVSFFIHER